MTLARDPRGQPATARRWPPSPGHLSTRSPGHPQTIPSATRARALCILRRQPAPPTRHPERQARAGETRSGQLAGPARSPTRAAADRYRRSRTPASARSPHPRSGCVQPGRHARGSARHTGPPAPCSRRRSPTSAAHPQAAQTARPEHLAQGQSQGQKRLHLRVAATASVTVHPYRALVYWIPSPEPAVMGSS